MKRLFAQLAAVAMACVPSAAASQPAPPPFTLSFSGYVWSVKTSTGPVGPGSNWFSARSVAVNGAGELVLSVAKDAAGHWQCGEVVGPSLGYGTYTFTLDGASIDALDPNITWGLFTWDNDDPAFAHRELDVEVGRWADPANKNAQFVVQPYTVPGNITRFSIPPKLDAVTVSFTWTSTGVTYRCAAGGKPVYSWDYTHTPPPHGNERVRINLWLFRPSPAGGAPASVTVRRFQFQPLVQPVTRPGNKPAAP